LSGAAAPAPWLALGLYLALLAVQRALELRVAARNERALRARGAVEHGAAHYPGIVALHVLWPLALLAEVAALGARPPGWWPLALGVLLAGNVLRVAAIRALGELWTTRVWVLPSHPVSRSGPYRWLRHPAYVAVTLELIAAPLLFGAWRTALAASAANAVVLAVRVRDENRALGIRPPAAE
jgi:methyltransferase